MNKLFTKIAGLTLGLAMAIGVGVAVASNRDATPVRAVEEVAYTLDGTQAGTGNAYTGDNTASQSGVSWTINGNLTTNPWRIGNGKNGSAGTRLVQSQGVVSSHNISKIVISTANVGITPSAITLKVGTSAGDGSVTNTSTTFATPSKTIDRPSNTDWSGKYFEIGFTIGATGSKYFQLTSIVFYYEVSTTYTVTTSTTGLTLSANSTTPAGGDITLTTAARMKGIDVTVSNTATSSVAGNVVSLSNVTANTTINATIVDATPTLGVTGQKTRFTLEDSWSFGGTVTKTYDDWVNPHTTDTVTSGNYTVDNSKFVAGVEGTYEIVVSVNGCADYKYDVVVSNIQEKMDLINVDAMEASGTSYATYTFNGSSSQTAYNSQNAVDSNVNLQYRSKNSNSGLVNTNSKGTIKSVKITVASDTTTVKIYAKNTPYTSPADLYGDDAGTNVTDITTSTNETYTFTDEYSYIGLRSSSGAIYLSSIEITWLVTPKAVHHIGASEVTEEGPFYVGTKPTLTDLGVTVTAYYDQAETDHEDVSTLATIVYPTSGLTADNNGGEGYTITYGGKSTSVDITAEVADVYAKLTSIVDLIAGSTVRIATDTAVMSSTAVTGTRLASVSGDPTNANLADVANMTVGADKDGYYFSIEINSETNYLTCPSDNAYLSFTTTLDAKSHWNVSIGANGTARIFNVSFTEREVRKNTSNDYFSSYKGGETAVSIFQLVDNDMTETEKVAAQIDTFGKLYLHKLDILDNETTRKYDGTTCNAYYDKAKEALTNSWSAIQEDFSKDTSGMWERYCSWAWVTYHEVPTFTGGVMSYSRTGTSFLIGNENSSATIIILIVSLVSLTAIAGFVILRKRKEQ